MDSSGVIETEGKKRIEIERETLSQRRLTFLAFRLLYPRLHRFSNEIAEFLPGAWSRAPDLLEMPCRSTR